MANSSSSEQKPLLPLLISSGEPAGIGPEICVKLATSDLAKELNRPLVFLGNSTLFTQTAQSLGLACTWNTMSGLGHSLEVGSHLLDMDMPVASIPGQLNPENARYVLTMLNVASYACLTKKAAGLVTAPIQKSVLATIEPGFQGHTEYLAKRCGQEESDVVMMLHGGGLKVALATTHLPLSKVAEALTAEKLEKSLRVLNDNLAKYWNVPYPRILVTGLNPHAGESGELGHEEETIIKPVIAKLKQENMAIHGPFPADTIFQPRRLQHADAVMAMYHDQGLPVLKFASFGLGVNVSLGLSIIRTSVDHGTALDLAGTGQANPASLRKAIECAHQMDLSRRA